MSTDWPRPLRFDATTLGEILEVTPVALGAVTQAPTRRDYWFGHAVHLHEPPADLGPIVDLWRRHLSDIDGLVKFVVVYEAPPSHEPPAGVSRRAAELGLEVDRSDLMRLTALEAPRPLADVAPRAATTDTDWACIGVLQGWMNPDVAPEFWRWMGATGFRAAAEAGHATAWLVHRHGEPACSVVIGRDGHGLAYIGSVVTHPAHRGHGLATALVHHACQVHAFRHPDDEIFLAADPGGPAQRLYERLGFRTVSGWWELVGAADDVLARLDAPSDAGAAG